MIGLIDLLDQIKVVWEEDEDRIIGESNRILAEVDRIYNSDNKGKLDPDILVKTKNQLQEDYDKIMEAFPIGLNFHYHNI